MKRKMQFVSNVMAATIQNLANQKKGPSNPKITAKDLGNALQLSYLAVFPGMTMYAVNNSWHLPYGYAAYASVNYVKGTGENQAQSKWIGIPFIGGTTSSPGYWNATSERGWNVVGYNSSPAKASNIYPDLVIKNGDCKIILACYLWIEGNGAYFTDGTPVLPYPRNKLFGFLFLTPPGGKPFKASDSQISYFPGVTIFTPIPGAFDDNVPQ